jgi:hypothetical protein
MGVLDCSFSIALRLLLASARIVGVLNCSPCLDAAQWSGKVFHIETRYWRAVGAVDALLAKARELGQC